MASPRSVEFLNLPDGPHDFDHILDHIVRVVRQDAVFGHRQQGFRRLRKPHSIGCTFENTAILANVHRRKMPAENDHRQAQSRDVFGMKSSEVCTHLGFDVHEPLNDPFVVKNTHVHGQNGLFHFGLKPIQFALQSLECDAAPELSKGPSVATQQSQTKSSGHPKCGSCVYKGIAIPVATRPKPQGKRVRCPFGFNACGLRHAQRQRW